MKSGVDQVAQGTYTLTGRSQTALLDCTLRTHNTDDQTEIQVDDIMSLHKTQ